MMKFINYYFFSIAVVDILLCKVSARICEYFNPSECFGPSKCNLTQLCSEDNTERWHCYALWTNVSGTPMVLMKGCWLDKDYCYNKQRCTVTEVNRHNNFCCCDSDLCNSDIDFEDVPNEFVTTITTASATNPQNDSLDMMKKTLLMSLCPLLILALIVIISFYVWRKFIFRASGYKTPSFQAITIGEKMDISKVELLEVVADGCFGPIWKGQLDGKFVAVKIMNKKGEMIWKVEKEFYELFNVVKQHDNILKFVGAEIHQASNYDNPDYWLITEFHHHGSLRDNLKEKTFTVQDVIHIAGSISKGLAFLHSSSNNPMKLPIAHRDLKSANVLLKEDMTACLADFGLSLLLKQNLNLINVHGQVGSVRYMAPEVLDGALNCNVESFLKIDIYSCSLIFWELLSRCSAFEIIGDYLRPFEAELGLNPSIDDMQNLVLNKKVRPHMKTDWWDHEILKEVCKTIEECWDHDAEARLTADSIEQRLFRLHQETYFENPSSSSHV